MAVIGAVLVVTVAAACSSTPPNRDASLDGGPGRPRPLAKVKVGDIVAPDATAGAGAVVSPSGVVVPVVGPADGGGWDVTTPCGRPATVTTGRFVAKATIVLDPGHGGSDPGAVSPGGRVHESAINLAVSQYAAALLTEAGVSVLLTRTGDYDLNLTPRADIAKGVGARAFVSIHHNAEPDGPWPRPGSETYYQIGSADSKRLAGLVYEEVVKALSQYRLAWVADTDAGAQYRPGSRGDYYAVLRQPAPIVSTLVELAFISNQAEAALLARPDVQKVEGEAVARGIYRYLASRDLGSGFTEPYERPTPPSSPAVPGGGTSAPCDDPPL